MLCKNTLAASARESTTDREAEKRGCAVEEADEILPSLLCFSIIISDSFASVPLLQSPSANCFRALFVSFFSFFFYSHLLLLSTGLYAIFSLFPKEKRLADASAIQKVFLASRGVLLSVLVLQRRSHLIDS
ncbi:hypothetical protein CKAN_01441800 [Cinnamomum micranthum f. kanehirae]|uniref:Transmembrane protein n=1 Tax=Cinnamomum micranthum f. kanehirae TaxID=337451 RepID=A0A443P449_9MAGN|nr:hypothetical protein CKAN_01441800 [Cinnamomum micranthum f. kanehirae]